MKDFCSRDEATLTMLTPSVSSKQVDNPNFKGVEFDPLLTKAGSNSYTMSPTRWIELTSCWRNTVTDYC